MRLKIILRYVGVALLSLSLLMCAGGFVALHADGDDSMMPLFFSAFLSFTVGIFQLAFTRHSSNISNKDGYYIVTFSWIAVCLFGMLPYLCYSAEFSFVDAMFESVSGFTTTGASILNDIESLPEGLLFWRAGSAWVGGFGIVTIFSLIVPKGHDVRSVLSRAEMSGIAQSQASKKGKSFILGMLGIYVTLTVICTISLKLTGMRWFDAATNAMCTCSSCGFCVRNNSIAYYNNPAAEYVLSLFMILAAVSFVAFLSAFRGKNFAKFFKSTVLKCFLGMMAVSTLLTSFDLARMNGFENIDGIFRTSLFQISSIITTTGYATTDTNYWPALSMVVICVASLICGCSGSTSGGIKIDRVVILAKDILCNIRIMFNPRKIAVVRIDNNIVPQSTVTETKSYVLIYFVVLLTGAAINTLAGLDFSTGVSASMACLGNVGPGFGLVGSMGNYSSLPVLSKYVSMLLMIAGRLEIIPIVFVISSLKELKNA